MPSRLTLRSLCVLCVSAVNQALITAEAQRVCKTMLSIIPASAIIRLWGF